ncbi:hypothetical protein [Cognatishimia sp. MH4019]|uniref:hypothetical protein n=1 Tax=Cognatishimia sp. MH4019 TaxID=2854030 RepID=UPI001CD64B2A|nr:hypothetical protein [Cognatishimia sp. MH4019]
MMELTFDNAGHVAGSAPDDVVHFGHYMMLADARMNLFSVFDDLKYDRSDVDMMSPGMRRHAIQKLGEAGFKQVSGRVLHNAAEDISCHIPKFHALGSSPFDITRYTPKRARDYYILTPTQTACQIIDGYELEEAVTKLEALVKQQPVNVFKLRDYLEDRDAHRAFTPLVGHLMAVQKEAVASEPLQRRRALS